MRIPHLPVRIPRSLAWAFVVLTIYFAAAAVVLPSVVRPMAEKKLTELLDRKVEIASVEVNPFALSATVDGFVVRGQDGETVMVSFDELYVNLELASLFRRAVVVSELTLTRPFADVERRKDGTYSFSYLLDKGRGKPDEPAPKPASEPMRFSVSNIRITQGNADFDDRPEGKKHTVRDMELSVPFVSNIGYYGDVYVQPYFAATVNGTPFELKGRTKPFSDSLETTLDIKVEKFDLPRYFAYVPVKLNFTLPSGFVYLDLKATYVQYKDERQPDIGLSGSAALVGLAIADTDGKELVGVKRAEVVISSSDLLERRLSISRVSVESPSLEVDRSPAGAINLVELFRMEKKPEPEEPAVKPYAEVEFFRLSDGRVHFTDRTVRGPFTATLYPIEVTMLNLKTIPGWKAQMNASVRTDAAEVIELNSKVTLEPPALEGALDVAGVPLPRYMPYVPDSVLADIRSGMLGLSTRFAFATDEAAPVRRLFGLSVGVDKLKITKRGEKPELVSVPEFRLADSSADLISREVVLGSIRTTGGRINAVRDADGAINLAGLVRKEAAPAKAAPAKAAQAKQALGAGPSSPAKASDAAEKPWTVTVADAAVGGYAVEFEDRATPKPMKLSITDAAVGLKGVTTRKGEAGEVSLSATIGKKGRAELSGTAVVDPPSAQLRVLVKDLDVSAFQPYFGDKLPMLLTAAYAQADGRLAVAVKKDEGPSAAYVGEAAITRFATVDKINAEDLLKWQSLHVTGASVGYNPTYADIKKVALTDFYVKAIVNEDRSLNLTGPKKEEAPAQEGEVAEEAAKPAEAAPAPAPEAKEKARPVKVSVDAITLQGGRVDFLDRSVSPNFKVDLTKIAGRVSGLSSIESKYAEVDLQAIYGGFAPIEIKGKVQPLRENPYVDLKADLTDIELSPMTPYSGKFLGYTIARGKLNMDLKYKIEDKKLEATNKIFVDQFYLGDPVDSPDATGLPVKLALALLRDRNGEIHLDVPLSGRTDDPEFSYFSIILQVVWNIITKAVTSPFSLLGALFGGGEDLGYVEFNYGSAMLTDSDRAKIDKLSESLFERPQLKLTIEGHADVEKDRDALRQLFFERKMKALKLKDMVDDGMEPVPVDDVVIPAEEYDDYLEDAYSDEDFPKPRNFLGMAKSLPPEEMTKLMLTNLVVTDDDLRKLCSERAAAVKTYLLGLGKVEPERVFTGEGGPIAPEKQDGVKDSRVVFKLE